MSLRRRISGVLATTAGVTVLTAVTQVLVSRSLSLTGRGHFDAVIGVTGLGAAVLAFGWPNSVVHQLRARGRAPDEMAGAGIIGWLLISAAAVAVAVPLRTPIANTVLAGADPSIVVPGVIALSLTLGAQVLSALARGMEWFGRFNLARLTDPVATLVAVVVALTLGDGGAAAAVAAVAIGRGAAIVVLAGTVLRGTGIRWRLSRDTVVDTMRFGGLAYAQSLAGLLHERIDIVLLAVIANDAEDVARYGVAVVGVTLLRAVAEAIGTGALPTMTERATHDRPSSAELAARLCRGAVGSTAVLGVAASLAAPLVVPLVFGDGYRASVGLFAILVPASVALAVYRILGRWLLAVDLHRPGITAQVASLGVNVALNLVLIPSYGAAGASTATLGSYLVSAVLVIAAFRRETGHRATDVLVPSGEDIRRTLSR